MQFSAASREKLFALFGHAGARTHTHVQSPLLRQADRQAGRQAGRQGAGGASGDGGDES
jgi:hypothetical protein